MLYLNPKLFPKNNFSKLLDNGSFAYLKFILGYVEIYRLGLCGYRSPLTIYILIEVLGNRYSKFKIKFSLLHNCPCHSV